jgi:hypothetical protein
MARRRQPWTDTLLVWGFVLSLAGFVAAGCCEAFKILSIIPSAFASAPALWRNPMTAANDDSPPNQPGRPQTTARERAQNESRAGEQDR